MAPISYITNTKAQYSAWPASTVPCLHINHDKSVASIIKGPNAIIYYSSATGVRVVCSAMGPDAPRGSATQRNAATTPPVFTDNTRLHSVIRPAYPLTEPHSLAFCEPHTGRSWSSSRRIHHVHSHHIPVSTTVPNAALSSLKPKAMIMSIKNNNGQ